MNRFFLAFENDEGLVSVWFCLASVLLPLLAVVVRLILSIYLYHRFIHLEFYEVSPFAVCYFFFFFHLIHRESSVALFIWLIHCYFCDFASDLIVCQLISFSQFGKMLLIWRCRLPIECSRVFDLLTICCSVLGS